MQKIVFLDRDTLAAPVRVARPNFEHQWFEYPATNPEEVVARLHGAQIAIVNKIRIGHNELAQLPELKMIAQAATGCDNIDLDACREHGVTVCNVRNYSGPSVPEHALTLMLMLARNFKGWQMALEKGRWQEEGRFCLFDYPIRDLGGQRLGIIGKGVIGKELARLAEAMGMEVVFSQSLRGDDGDTTRLPLDELLATSDVISLHCPLTTLSRNLIGAREFSLMKPGALLINVGRGGLVDEDALVVALESGHLGGAGFDVVTQEPPPADHPLMKALKYPNFILTPHVAWTSEGAMQRLADQVIENIESFVTGSAKNRVV